MWSRLLAIPWKLSFVQSIIGVTKIIWFLVCRVLAQCLSPNFKLPMPSSNWIKKFRSNLCNYISKLRLDVLMLSEFLNLKSFWERGYWFYWENVDAAPFTVGFLAMTTVTIIITNYNLVFITISLKIILRCLKAVFVLGNYIEAMLSLSCSEFWHLLVLCGFYNEQYFLKKLIL